MALDNVGTGYCSVCLEHDAVTAPEHQGQAVALSYIEQSLVIGYLKHECHQSTGIGGCLDSKTRSVKEVIIQHLLLRTHIAGAVLAIKVDTHLGCC